MKILLVLGCSIVLSACGQVKPKTSPSSSTLMTTVTSTDSNTATVTDTDTSSQTSTSTDITTANALIGTWAGKCAGGVIPTITFDDKTSTTEYTGYSNDNCDGEPFVKLSIERTYTVDGGNIDYVLTKATYIILVEDDVAIENQAKTYGFDNWEVNVAKDVTGCYMDPNDDTSMIDNAGDKLFQIYRISSSGKSLLFGDASEFDGTTEDTRPIYYNLANPLTKK